MVKEVGGSGDHPRTHSPTTPPQSASVIAAKSKSTAYAALNKVAQWSKAFDKRSSPAPFRHSVSTSHTPGAQAVSKAAERPLPGPQRREMCAKAYAVANTINKMLQSSVRMLATLGATRDLRVRLPMNFTATRSAAKTTREGRKARSIIQQNSDPQGPGAKGSNTGGNQKGRR